MFGKPSPRHDNPLLNVAPEHIGIFNTQEKRRRNRYGTKDLFECCGFRKLWYQETVVL
jgi:hypothetical protein